MNRFTSSTSKTLQQKKWIGLIISMIIIFLWILNLSISLNTKINFYTLSTYFLFLLQIHLFTGLFITAHDAMHGTVAPHHPKTNQWIGKISTFLYAFFPYEKLRTAHYKHHRHVHTEADPDYYEGNFFSWYLSFIRHYLTIWQILGYAISFNILKLFFPTPNLLFFWIAPALLSTLQLFYFGTYQPHKGEHHNKHQSRSQHKNHFWAFISCYFFGYHYEHHDMPHVPWWALWKVKR